MKKKKIIIIVFEIPKKLCLEFIVDHLSIILLWIWNPHIAPQNTSYYAEILLFDDLSAKIKLIRVYILYER